MIVQKIIEICTNCKSENIVKNGKTKTGQQKYHCKDCKCYRTLNPKIKYPQTSKVLILKAYQERASLRGIQRIFGVHRHTLSRWLKKR